jgi:hypothetical protein
MRMGAQELERAESRFARGGSGEPTEVVVEEGVRKMNEKALRMLKHVRIQIFGHPSRYVVVRESHGDNPAALRGSLCSDLR